MDTARTWYVPVAVVSDDRMSEKERKIPKYLLNALHYTGKLREQRQEQTNH